MGRAMYCIFASNSANYGGGFCGQNDYRIDVWNCSFVGNTATNGGAVYGGTVAGSTIVSNRANLAGGGAHSANLTNCLVRNCTAATFGGGTFGGQIGYSTIIGNSAPNGGGACQGNCVNSIVYLNSAEEDYPNYYLTTFDHSCSDPLPSGAGNIVADPSFVNAGAGNCRLRYGSPCIDAGPASGVDSDIDGTPRPLDGNGSGGAQCDMGCHEYNPMTADSNEDGIPDWWCLRYSFGPNLSGLADANPDMDASNNRAEWEADTDPTNSLSFFAITSIDVGEVCRVGFNSSTSSVYGLQMTQALISNWSNVQGQTDISGTGGAGWLQDTNRSGSTGVFYRVWVHRRAR